MSNITGKVALVTGASSGIGRAVAQGLAAAGAKVAVVARRQDRLDRVVQTIESGGGTALSAPADVTDPEAAAGVVDRALAHFGRVDILVNAAGMSQTGSVETADLDQYRQVMELNLMSAVYTCRAVSGPMKGQGSGDVINISSMASTMAVGGMSAYATSKRALNAMTDGLRQDLSPSGVRVCLLIPGGTKTEFAESITSEQSREAMRAYLSRDGMMEASDIADAVVFIVGLPRRVNIPHIRILPTAEHA